MKRSMGTSTPIRMFGPKISDNSTTIGSQLKRLKRDGSRPKHLRRGPSHASSAEEYMKSEWTCDELDITKEIPSLSDLSQDKFKLVEELFSIFSILELKEFTPDILKEYSVNQLKELCFEELNSISTKKLKFMTEGNDPKDYVEPEIDVDDKAIGDTADGIQLSVDDNEYSDFLGEESLEQRKPKKVMKDAVVQANWSSLESSSDDESHSDNRDGEGWMNLWKLEQMEILELEMRARAIRMLLKQQQEEESTHKTTDNTNPNELSKKIDEMTDALSEETKTSTSNVTKDQTKDTESDPKPERITNREDMEEGEASDSDQYSNHESIDEIPKEISEIFDKNEETNDENQENIEIESQNESKQNQVLDETNASLTEPLNEDNNQISDVEENPSEDEVEGNENAESNDDNTTEAEKEDNETVEEIEIIAINEEIDEELMEKSDEDIENEESNDKQSVASDSDNH